MEDNIGKLLYGFDKNADKQAYVERAAMLKEVRDKLSMKEGTAPLSSGSLTKVTLTPLRRKEMELILQIYSLPKRKKLDEVVKYHSVEKNLARLKGFNKTSKYFTLIEETIFSTLELGLNSFREKIAISQFALDEIRNKITEMKQSYHTLLNSDKERLSSLMDLRKKVEEDIEFFASELKLGLKYSQQVSREIEKMK